MSLLITLKGAQSGASGAVAVDDGGAEVIAEATRLNFAGDGVAVADAGSGEATITIPGGPLVVMKTADETLNNTDVLQNDDHLVLPIGANETWIGEIILSMKAGSNTTADFKAAITVPAGATLAWFPQGARLANDWLVEAQPIVTVSGTAAAFGAGTAAGTHARIRFRVVNGANAGNVQLQWAQNTATAFDSTIAAGSMIIAQRVGSGDASGGPHYIENWTDLGNLGATETIAGHPFTLRRREGTLNADCAITIDLDDNEQIDLILTQDGTGGRAATFVGVDVWKTALGTAPSLTGRAAAAVDRLKFEKVSGTTFGYWATETVTVRKVKTADEATNNSTTLQDDDHLVFAVGANEDWVARYTLFVEGDAAADFKAAVTVPAGATLHLAALGPAATTAAGTFLAPVIVSGTATGQLGAAATGLTVELMLWVENAGTAGNVTLQHAQFNNVASDTTVKKGSHLVAERVA